MVAPGSDALDPVSLLTALIRRPSVTPDEAGVFAVLEGALRPLGFSTERVGFSGDGSYPVDNLFATRGQGERHLLFVGHTDVVPPGGGWTHEPFAADVVDGLIYGRGTADMKSGIAAFVAALARVGDIDGRVSLAITNDEEQDAINGTEKLLAWAEARGHRFDFCIVGEPSATSRVGDSIKIGRRGSFGGRLVATGTQGHVAYPQHARNPLPVLAAAVTALASGRLDEGTERFPPSNLEFTSIDVGNTASNVIPARGEARFNIRFNDRWTPETLTAWIGDRLAGVERGGCDIAFQPVARAARAFVSPLAGGTEILVRAIERFTGTPPDLSTGGGTSDARFVARYCPVVECGLPGHTMHKADEHVRIADVEALTQLYADFIRDYFA